MRQKYTVIPLNITHIDDNTFVLKCTFCIMPLSWLFTEKKMIILPKSRQKWKLFRRKPVFGIFRHFYPLFVNCSALLSLYIHASIYYEQVCHNWWTSWKCNAISRNKCRIMGVGEKQQFYIRKVGTSENIIESHFSRLDKLTMQNPKENRAMDLILTLAD